MADVAVAPRRHAAPGPAEGNGARPLRRRRSLPGGRAVVGGFLVALAAVGIFAGYTGAGQNTSVAYLVAGADLPLGHRITAGDLTTAAIDLPAGVRAGAFRDPAALVGAVVIGPVAKGELVQASDVQQRSPGALDRQLSFSIESARAVGGSLRPGEFVDVVATYGTGADSYTVVVARGARVAGRAEPGGSLSDTGDEVVTLALPDPAETLAVAHAVNAGAVTLVRSDRAGGEAPTTYRAPAPDAGR